MQYLLCQTYRLQGNETILFHAGRRRRGPDRLPMGARWAKLIGTVSSPEKAELPCANGAWEIIDYTCVENVAERVLELTGGKKVPVVYDGVGKDTWETSLDDCIEPRGLMVSFGTPPARWRASTWASWNQKGSQDATRLSLGVHVNTLEKLQAAWMSCST